MMKEARQFVLFGFLKSDDSQVGYFGANNQIVEDVKSAHVFEVKRSHGTPTQWLDLINHDVDLNHGYMFHIVNLKAKEKASAKK